MNKTMTVLVATVCIALLAIPVGCSGYQSAPATGTPNPPTGTPDTGTSQSRPRQSGVTIAERGNAFSPNTAEVSVGDVVTFTNEDSAFHQVSIGGADLGRQGQTESVSWTATRPGTYEYVCKIHPTMRGTIVVR